MIQNSVIPLSTFSDNSFRYAHSCLLVFIHTLRHGYFRNGHDPKIVLQRARKHPRKVVERKNIDFTMFPAAIVDRTRPLSLDYEHLALVGRLANALKEILKAAKVDGRVMPRPL